MGILVGLFCSLGGMYLSHVFGWGFFGIMGAIVVGMYLGTKVK